MISERCPVCLDLPLSQAINCEACEGTQLHQRFKRPKPVYKLSHKITEGVQCPKCDAIETIETYYPIARPTDFITHTFCNCTSNRTTEPLKLTYYDFNPKHPDGAWLIQHYNQNQVQPCL